MEKDKRVFGSFIAPYERELLSNSTPASIYGLSIFAPRFIEALLRYGTFDEFHFFSRGPADPLQKDELLGSDPRVRLFPLRDFRAAAQNHAYTVFHNPWTPDIGPWFELRNRFCAKSVPVSGMIHTVSYQSFLPRVLATMMLGPQPSDSIVCTSECGRTVMRNWIAHLKAEFGAQIGRPVDFRGRLDKIPIGIDSQRFRPQDKPETRRRLELPQDRTILLYFGRFSAYDKMDLAPLLLAFKAARKKLQPPAPEMTLVLAGAAGHFGYADQVASLAQELEIADAVQIRTNIAAENVAALYAAADIFVSPSDNVQETFGQSIVEAMASGLPVICSDWNGYREIVIPGETGFLIPTCWMQCDRDLSDFASMSDWMMDHFALAQSVSVDVEKMSAAIEILAANPEMRERMGQKGRDRAASVYDWRVVIGQYLELWVELNRIAEGNTAYSSLEASPYWARAPRRGSWYRPELFKTFEHYCTTVLPDEAQLSVRNAAWLESKSPLSAAQSQLLGLDLMRTIVNGVESGASIRQLQDRVTAETGCSPDDFRFHMLWLLKYGVLAVGA